MSEVKRWLPKSGYDGMVDASNAPARVGFVTVLDHARVVEELRRELNHTAVERDQARQERDRLNARHRALLEKARPFKRRYDQRRGVTVGMMEALAAEVEKDDG